LGNSERLGFAQLALLKKGDRQPAQVERAIRRAGLRWLPFGPPKLAIKKI
jgi:hypothetical protein